MGKHLFYLMSNDKMYLLHAFWNALDLAAKGGEVKIIFEGAAVKAPIEMKDNPAYQNALAGGLVAGVCLGCAEMMKVKGEIEALGLTLLADMNNHAGISPYTEKGYAVLVF